MNAKESVYVFIGKEGAEKKSQRVRREETRKEGKAAQEMDGQLHELVG